MEILDVMSINEHSYSTAVALGNFDGVHVGHQKLISTMISKGKEMGLKSSLLLFENHTKTVLKKVEQKLITPFDHKLKILESMGVELIFKMIFDETIMRLSPEDFVKKILIDKLNCKAVVVGYDYRFGHKASGDAIYLKELGKKYGFHVTIIEPVYIENKVVSSTEIRELLLSGKLEEARKMLGRNYSIVGKIVPGKKIGNKLGFPTANIEPLGNYIIPKYGVYDTNTIIDNKSYLSASSVGFNPTFNDKSLKIETHILDFNENIYGKTIELEFVRYLREEEKFSDLSQLIKQIEADIMKVKTRY